MACEQTCEDLAMARICGYCGGSLVWTAGEEESARERAGNARERDEFRCDGCARRYRHSVSERFDGNSEWWGEYVDGRWEDVPADRVPTFTSGS